MKAQSIGLTELYNQFHDRSRDDADIENLRRQHETLDHAVAGAYGWNDLDLRRDWISTFSESDDEGVEDESTEVVRYSISEDSRERLLARLLELNAQRAREQSSPTTPASGSPGEKPRGRPSKGAKTLTRNQSNLFGNEDDK